MKYLGLSQLLDLVEGSNKTACLSLWHDNADRFEAAPGSKTKHQAWPGGYIHHLEEAMNFGYGLFFAMDQFRALEFSLSDVMLTLFLHDLEKPFKYIEPKARLDTDEEKSAFIGGLIGKYGIELNENHTNALRYVHGEGDAYSKTERIQRPLAAFIHICDVASARIWFDYPKVETAGL